MLNGSYTLPRDIADSDWSAALARWPDHDVVLFGAANFSRLDGDTRQAAARYRRLVKLYPEHVPGLNNFADLLMAGGCLTAARRAIEAASANQAFAPEFSVIVDDTWREIESAFARIASEKQATCHLAEP